jgi:hypothetical protein
MQQRRPLLWMSAIMIFMGMASLALPLAAHAGVRLSIGIGVPVYPAPVVVAPAPVVVAPPPAVVYSAPVVVAPPSMVYGAPPVVVGGYYGPRHRHWRHHHYRWHRW